MASTVELNFSNWADSLKKSHPYLADELGERRSNGFKRLEELGLPRFEFIESSLASFLEDPHECLSRVKLKQFYIVLMPNIPPLQRHSKAGINADQVIAFIHEHVAPEHIKDYDISWQAYSENIFGGTIIVNPGGQIYVEFKRGKQAKLAKGTEDPEFFAVRNSITGLFRYSFDDPVLRRSIYNLVLALPHEKDNLRGEFRPGYYEFTLIQEDNTPSLRPIFFDYREGPVYHLPDQLPVCSAIMPRELLEQITL